MPKLKIFTAPKDYSEYTFWRAAHQQKAILVIYCAACWWFARWLT